MWFVYLLKSEVKNWHYIGSTNSLERRLREHNSGWVQATKAYAPLRLIFSKEFNDEKSAREYERLVKDKRIEKEKLIRENS